MEDKDQKILEEKMKSIEDILNGFGLSEDMIDHPEKIKEKFSDFGKAWIAKEKIKNESESLKYSVRTIWSLLPAISALSGTLLVVATFNRDLIEINFSVRIILTLLLILIPVGLWGNYIDSKKGIDAGLKRMIDIMKKDVNKDVSNKIKELNKPSILGYLPLFINFIFTFAIILIILLIWKIDLIALFIS